MRYGDPPIRVDKTHCKMAVPDKEKGVGMFGQWPLKVVIRECDWEFSYMIGMEECNCCGMTR